LKFGTESMTRFKAAYVSGPVSEEQAQAVQTGPQVQRQIVWYGADYVTPQIVAQPAAAAGAVARPESEASLFDVIVKRLAGQGPPAHQIWLPPLDESPSLDELMPGLSATPMGLTPAGWDQRGLLRVPVGIVDRPFDQRRDPLWLDLSSAAGHIAVVGGPQTGKSTMLRTLIAGLSLLHTPQEVQFYCLDFGGGTLSTLNGLPHVGGVATRLDTERVRRTVAEVSTLLANREQDFTERGIDSIATYRRLRAEGRLPGATSRWMTCCQVRDGWYDITSAATPAT
jgi:S-DNA-T family DNA segregation ATPase FtsK/SpoIIIE